MTPVSSGGAGQGRSGNDFAIGIVGNLGPVASWRLYGDLIMLFQKRRRATRNSQFPRINVDAPESIENVREVDDSGDLAKLRRSVDRLNSSNVDLIAIPCNTVGRYRDELQRTSQAHILDIVEETVNSVAKASISRRPYLLATRRTIRSQRYQKQLLRRGIKTEVPGEKVQEWVDLLIDKICAGDNSVRMCDVLARLAEDSVFRKSADGVILGCTELSEITRSLTNPLSSPRVESTTPVYDSLWSLSVAAYRESCRIVDRN